MSSQSVSPLVCWGSLLELTQKPICLCDPVIPVQLSPSLQRSIPCRDAGAGFQSSRRAWTMVSVCRALSKTNLHIYIHICIEHWDYIDLHDMVICIVHLCCYRDGHMKHTTYRTMRFPIMMTSSHEEELWVATSATLNICSQWSCEFWRPVLVTSTSVHSDRLLTWRQHIEVYESGPVYDKNLYDAFVHRKSNMTSTLIICSLSHGRHPHYFNRILFLGLYLGSQKRIWTTSVQLRLPLFLLQCLVVLIRSLVAELAKSLASSQICAATTTRKTSSKSFARPTRTTSM